MFKLFSFQNFKESNYRNIIFFSILSGIAMQAFLLPSLDYIALDLKQGHQFYNYATIATLAGTIPQAISLLIGYFVNNIKFKKVISIGFALIFISSIATLIFHQYFVTYVIWIILCGIIFNAIFLNISRQICSLFNDKIKQYQSDSMLLSNFGNMIGFRLGSTIYNHFHLSGLIISFILINVITFLIIKKVKFNDEIENFEQVTFNIKYALKTIINNKQLIIFLGLMFSIIFVGSGFNIFILGKIHTLNLGTHAYANCLTMLTLGGILGALIIKTNKMQNANSFKSQIGASIFFIMTYVIIGNSASSVMILGAMLMFGLSNIICLVNMNTICFNFIQKDKALLQIAPMINGFMQTGFYTLSLLGPIMYSTFLQHGFQINFMMNIVVMLYILIDIVFCLLLISKKLKMQ